MSRQDKQINVEQFKTWNYQRSKEEFLTIVLERNARLWKHQDDPDYSDEIAGNYLTFEQLRLDFNIKKPESFVKRLIAKNMIRIENDRIFLIEDESYCRRCWDNVNSNHYSGTEPKNCRTVFDFDQENHMRTVHNWNNNTFKLYDMSKLFTKTMPQETQEHVWKLDRYDEESATVYVKCPTCGETRSERITPGDRCQPDRMDERRPNFDEIFATIRMEDAY